MDLQENTLNRYLTHQIKDYEYDDVEIVKQKIYILKSKI